MTESAELIGDTGSLDIDACYQCRKCVSGCSLAYAMDYTPLQLLHAVRLGLRELVLASSTIWLCVACETCVTRCPQRVDLPQLFDRLREMALREKAAPAEPEIAGFYQAGLQNIRTFGRLYEVGLIGQLKLTTRKFTKDLELGWGMFKRGKLKLVPHLGSLGKARKIFARSKKAEQR
jgi:heterodisulfide reductase subunit C